MKGQLIFQFIIAAIIFFAIIIYTINFLNIKAGYYADTMFTNDLEMKLLTISEVLTKNTLSENWPVLDANKINDFISDCNQHKDDVYRRLGIENYNFKISITSSKITNFNYECGDNPSGVNVAHIKRYAVVDWNGEIKPVSMEMWLWR